MGKLHELLAVEGDLKGIQDRILKETEKTFSRNELFIGFSKLLKMEDEGRAFEEDAGKEEKAITTTVMDRLEYTAEHVSKYYDALMQKELTNQIAKADLVVGGETIAKDLPATLLLGLEQKLKVLKQAYDKMPTLPAGIHWIEDPDQGDGIFRTKFEEVSNKTEKVIVPQILYAHTDKHPAQVEKLSRDVVVGKITKTTWCGMLTSAKKAQLLGRLDKLIQAVKSARMKANDQEVVKGEIGGKLFNYLHGE